MHALLLGATGATGKDLLHLLLKDDSFQRVDIFVRRKPEVEHQKLHVHVINFDDTAQWSSLVKGDVLFSCLGTTLKDAGSKEAQWKIDHDYQYHFAKAAKVNNVPCYVLVSAGHASPKSVFFYSRMKGMLEEAVKGLHFEKFVIFNPPLLVRKNTERKGEVAALKIFQFLNKFGLAQGQKPLPTEVLAQAMINAAKSSATGFANYQGLEIWNMSRLS